RSSTGSPVAVSSMEKKIRLFPRMGRASGSLETVTSSAPLSLVTTASLALSCASPEQPVSSVPHATFVVRPRTVHRRARALGDDGGRTFLPSVVRARLGGTKTTTGIVSEFTCCMALAQNNGGIAVFVLGAFAPRHATSCRTERGRDCFARSSVATSQGVRFGGRRRVGFARKPQEAAGARSGYWLVLSMM